VEHRSRLTRKGWRVSAAGIARLQRREVGPTIPWGEVAEVTAAERGLGPYLDVRPEPRGPVLRLLQLSHSVEFLDVVADGLLPRLTSEAEIDLLRRLRVWRRMYELDRAPACVACGGELTRVQRSSLVGTGDGVWLQVADLAVRQCASCARLLPDGRETLGDVGNELLDALERWDLTAAGPVLRVPESRWAPAMLLDASGRGTRPLGCEAYELLVAAVAGA
jgi:hypothetical protein